MGRRDAAKHFGTSRYDAAMAVYLDDQPVTDAGDALGAVVAATNQRLSAAGRMIVEVEVDGEGLAGEALAARQHEPIAGREVRLTSASPGDLAVQVLDQVRGRLHESRQLQAECASLIQQDKAPEALRQFNQVITAWLQVQEAVQNVVRLMGMDVQGLQFEGTTAAEATTELVASLQGLKRMIQDGDTVGIADALAYEWPDMTDCWDRMLADLIERIETSK